jgi:hypothetical protein
VPAVQPRFEEALKSAGLADDYNKHRGRVLERNAIALLTKHLPSCNTYPAIEYFTPDEARDEKIPLKYSKLVEGDGLIVVDDVAIVVEAKSGALSALSRTGHAPRLKGDLGKLVASASRQAARLRDLILRDRGLQLRDRSWLDLSGVSEVHTIAVTLEDLSGITTLTSELVEAGLLHEVALPWAVSLHDLRIISEIIARPAELLLYLRRRTEPEVTKYYHAVDELDLFLYMYRKGLYVEPDPDRVESELPQFGPRSVAERRRRKAQRRTILTSHTDPVDAWYFYQLGVRSTPAEKPRINSPAALLDMVDSLAALGEPGWLSIGATLLEGSSVAQRNFALNGPKLIEMTRRDGREHSLTILGGSRKDDSYVLVWLSVPTAEEFAGERDRIRRYLSAKKHQAQVWRAAAFVYAAESGALVATLFDNRRPGPDEELDAQLHGLRPLGSEMRKTVGIPNFKQRRQR